ncbi:MAG: methyltransferase domain-containing protein [Pseudomonadota bacterium]
MLARGLRVLGLLDEGRLKALNYHMGHPGAVKWADATKRIPQGDATVDVVYSSHMLEHLDREEVRNFLREARRVLVARGVLRIAVPDLAVQTSQYVATGDADSFIEGLHMSKNRPKRLIDKFAWGIIGPRHHMWMYDGVSLSRLLISNGFLDPVVLPPGQTTISDPGELDLWERSDESVYVEARAPGPP